jgi:ribosome biogenesis GTPase / thiamine phosphate phosphatase
MLISRAGALRSRGRGVECRALRQEGARVLLEDLGWNGYFEALWKDRFGGEEESPKPARVISQQRGLWRIAGEFDECWAEPSGKLRGIADVEGEAAWPAVGDWVAAEIVGEERAILHWVLPRRGVFSRKAPGKRVEQQVIATNVDVAFLVAALDMDFSPRRLERYLAQCWDSGVRPVVVLNKADECDDVGAHVAATERVGIGVPVIALSARTGQGMEALASLLSPGKTIVLLGSSGVGKSTLVNRLLQEEKQATQPTREADSKGRHTTTARELFRLPGGALLMDTPGLREFALWNVDAGLVETFADIEELARECRFGDCRHEGEPGCAVRAAVESGTMDEARVENRKKLEREQEFQRRKSDPEAMQEYKTKVSRMMRGVREKYKQRDRDGKL